MNTIAFKVRIYLLIRRWQCVRYLVMIGTMYMHLYSSKEKNLAEKWNVCTWHWIHTMQEYNEENKKTICYWFSMFEMRSIMPLSAMMRGFAGKVSSLANFNMVLEALKAHFPQQLYTLMHTIHYLDTWDQLVGILKTGVLLLPWKKKLHQHRKIRFTFPK